jgi:hypothetical protein
VSFTSTASTLELALRMACGNQGSVVRGDGRQVHKLDLDVKIAGATNRHRARKVL